MTLAGHNPGPIPVDLARVRSNEIEVLGSRYASKQDLVDALDLAAAGYVKPVVTRTAPLEDAESIHDALEAGTILGRAAIVL